MALRQTVVFPDMNPVIAAFQAGQAVASSKAIAQAADGIKADWRGQVTGAGLGARLANTVRGRTFPGGGKPSLDPAAYVFSRAPVLMYAYSEGVTITTVNGAKFLAIPSRNVPLKARGRKMTPLDVEVSFNQDLILIPRHGRILAFVNAVASASRKGWRKATPKRLAQGRDLQLVFMFTLVPQVQVRKRLDLDSIAAKWADRVGELIDQNWPA